MPERKWNKKKIWIFCEKFVWKNIDLYRIKKNKNPLIHIQADDIAAKIQKGKKEIYTFLQQI